VLSAPAAAHLSAEPAFMPAGGRERIALTVHNDFESVMTGFALTVPPGFRILDTGGEGSWTAVVEGRTATWTGGTLAPLTPVGFEVELEAADTPGAVDLSGTQLYSRDRSISWPVTLTVTPRADGSSGGFGPELAIVAGAGVLVLLGLGVVVVLRRRASLQER
jgi:predicted cobalt transporter CbtA